MPRHFISRLIKPLCWNMRTFFDTQIIMKKFYFFSSSIRISGKNIIFDDKKINKSNFYKSKKVFSIYDTDVDKILILKKNLMVKKSSFKYFLGYNGDDVIRPLCIKFPQMIGYVKHFDSNKTMSFKVNDNRLLKKYTKIWDKVSILMNIEFDSEPVYGDNDKYIKAKIKWYRDKGVKYIEIDTNFQGNKNTKIKRLI